MNTRRLTTCYPVLIKTIIAHHHQHQHPTSPSATLRSSNVSFRDFNINNCYIFYYHMPYWMGMCPFFNVYVREILIKLQIVV